MVGLVLCVAFASITLLHFPIVMNMLSTLHCTYDSDGQNGHMQRMPEQACWHGRHWHFVLVAVPILLVIYPLMIYFERKARDAGHSHTHGHRIPCRDWAEDGLTLSTTSSPPPLDLSNPSLRKHPIYHPSQPHLHEWNSHAATTPHPSPPPPLTRIGNGRDPPQRLSAAEISHHVRFTASALIGKLALSAASTILVRESPCAYLLVCAAMLILFLHVNNQRAQDDQPASCNVHSVRLARSMLLTCVTGTCLEPWSPAIATTMPCCPFSVDVGLRQRRGPSNLAVSATVGRRCGRVASRSAPR